METKTLTIVLPNFEELALFTAGLIALLLGYCIGMQYEQKRIANRMPIVQTGTAIYSTFTVNVESGIVESLYVDNDAFPNVACDGWIEDNEDGHHCIVMNSDDMRAFLTNVNLVNEYEFGS